MVRPGLITPTMSSPIFRESDCVVRGEEHTAGSYQPGCLQSLSHAARFVLSAAWPDECIVQSMATALSNMVSVSVEHRRDYFTVLAAMEPAPPDAEQRRIQRVGTRVGVWRVPCCMRACLCPRAAATPSPRPTVRPAVRSRSDQHRMALTQRAVWLHLQCAQKMERNRVKMGQKALKFSRLRRAGPAAR